jgi:hypothetical protein
MKTALLLSVLAAANAALTQRYLRDIMTETTARSYEKDPTTGLFRCEPGFTGSDCSQLKCPYSMSFATSNIGQDWLYAPSAAEMTKTYWPTSGQEDANYHAMQCMKDTTFDNQHAYRECGGRGLCDRSTGECKCFPSFTGEGCRRTTCPNDCSGHGQCRTDANSFYYLGQTPSTAFGTNIPDYSKANGASTWGIHWPWLKYQQCHCDAGYEGDDCSLRQCPKGDDPETDCQTDRGSDHQKFACSYEGTATSAFFQLRFVDQFGGEYDTRPIKIDTTLMSTDENANSIQDALEALPNFAIPEVEVDVDQSTKASPVISIYFTDGHNTGQQKMLQLITRAECEHGAQPKFEVSTTNDAANKGDIKCTLTREDAYPANNVYRERATCSNRGICDQSTGLCNCFDGYFGLACDHVNTYI